MIIRNPYGFYARHNKIIHIVLLLPVLYLLFCFSDIARFFQSYVTAGYSTPETSITDTYINGYMFLVSFLLAFANGTIFVILASKKKQNLYYGICTLYFLSLLIFLLLFGSSMSSIEQSKMAATFANFVRDCAKISYLPLYAIAIINIGKGVGFNIRTLRFDAGSDLTVSEEDEEDIEIKIGNDEGDAKRIIVHIIHELKYYVLENQFVMKCIGVVVLIVLGYNIYMNVQVYNKTYAVNQAFNLNNFTLSIKDSYITDIDYRGNVIEEGKYYLVIKMGIQNNSETPASVEKSSFRIVLGKKTLYPSFDKSSRFLDIGATYQGEPLYKDQGDDYVFVYELTKKDIRGSYQMRILSSLTMKYDGLDYKYKKITIRPQNILKHQDLGKAKARQEISLKNTTLGNTTYKISGYEVGPNYQYSYERCNNGPTSCITTFDNVVANGGYMIVAFDDEIKWDESTEYFSNSEKDFYSDFVTLTYWFKNKNASYEGSELLHSTITLKNITPASLKDKKIYEVPNTFAYAEKVIMKIRVRNKTLTVTVKE